MKTPDLATEPRESPALKRDNGFRYRPRFAVIVMCDGEDAHRETFERLTALGLACKVVRV